MAPQRRPGRGLTTVTGSSPFGVWSQRGGEGHGVPMMVWRRALLPVLLCCVPLGACTIPTDPDGTLDRVRESRVLRVGASPSGDLVVVEGDDVTGQEADLATGFAESLGAEVEWHPGGEEELVGALERGEVDLLIGGLTAKSPWASKAGLTRAYAESTEHGEKVEHVLATPLGENALLSRLEEYLDGAGQ